MVKRAGNLTDHAADKTTGIVLVKKTPYFLLYILKEQAECSRRESAAVDAVYHYDLPCEKANQENPQIFLICKYKNNFSDEFAQSNAEGI